jgi:hypothetical protein
MIYEVACHGDATVMGANCVAASGRVMRARRDLLARYYLSVARLGQTDPIPLFAWLLGGFALSGNRSAGIGGDFQIRTIDV